MKPAGPYVPQRLAVLRNLPAIARLLVTGACCLSLAVGPGARRAAAIGYTITDLGSLGGGRTIPSGLNNLGQVVGRSNTDPANTGYLRGFLYDATGMHDLGSLLGSPGANGEGINDLGQIVGSALFSTNPGTPLHAFFYDGSLHDLTSAAPGLASDAVAVNARGHVAGWAEAYRASNAPRHAFLYDGTGTHDLGVLPGYYQSIPWSMNASDQVVGILGTDGLSNGSHGFLWKDGVMRDLGTLGGDYSLATGINDAGQVVGKSTVVDGGYQHAFLYDSSGMHDLTALVPGMSYAWGINNLGQVVGTSDSAGSAPHLFLYSGGVGQDLTPLFLSAPTWEWIMARGINDRGQILVNGTINGIEHAYLVSPTPAPRLGLSPSSSEFGYQPVGASSAPQTITLTNTGDLPLAISGVSIGGTNPARFAIASDSGETTLARGASRTVQIAFTPSQTGSFTAVLIIKDNDPFISSPHSVTLTGSGAVPAVTLSPDAVDLGSHTVGSTTDEYHIGVDNEGLVPLIIRSVTITGPDAGDFTTTDLSGVTLAPTEGRTLSVHFTPAAPGSRSATLVVATNAPDSEGQLTLTGIGLAPVVSISPSSLNFGAQALGVVNDAQAMTLQNTGNAPLDIQSVALTGANPGDFSIAADGWTGAHLLAGQIATLNLRFAPTAAGARGASLTVSDNAAGGQQTVNLSGTGTAPAARLDATSLNFSDQLVNTTSAEQTLTLTNAGTAPLTLGNLTLSGANSGDFSAAADPGGLALAPGQSRTLRVRFRPAAPGSRSATLSISDSAADSPQTVALSGNGTAPAISFGISRLAGPGSLSFGSQPLGASSNPQTIALTNTGTAPLTIGSIALAGVAPGDYQITGDTGGNSLAPGTTRTLTLRFTPMALGSRSASLMISDNAAGGQQTVALTGSGVLPRAGRPGLVLPIDAELVVTSVNGSPPPGGGVLVSVGQVVSLKLMLKFQNGAMADVTADPNSRFSASPGRGKFTGPGVWSPQLADAGRTVTLTGSYSLPRSGKRWTGALTVAVQKVSRRR